jgi:hypothetical protein
MARAAQGRERCSREVTCRRFSNDALVDGRLLGELEVSQVLLIWKIAELKVQLHDLLVPKAHLRVGVNLVASSNRADVLRLFEVSHFMV